ncbi:MAG: C_GCAxxG_C_C family protein [Candidatus Helarchaeota archaeon]|nr:C_GCAxxG_C_C family protein [Candidatus Helarchaeota archaeon]
MIEIVEVETRFENKIKELMRDLPEKYIGSKIAWQNCAALTMKSFLEIIDVEDLNLINMASPLASIAGVCGAVNAGLMITGLIIGKNGKKKLHQLTAATEGRKFLIRFQKEFASCNCQTLTGGYNLLTMDGMENYLKDKIWEKKCYRYVVKALEIIGKLHTKQIARLI